MHGLELCVFVVVSGDVFVLPIRGVGFASELDVLFVGCVPLHWFRRLCEWFCGHSRCVHVVCARHVSFVLVCDVAGDISFPVVVWACPHVGIDVFRSPVELHGNG